MAIDVQDGAAPLLALVRFHEGPTPAGDRYMVTVAGLHLCEVGAEDADVIFARHPDFAVTVTDEPDETVFTFATRACQPRGADRQRERARIRLVDAGREAIRRLDRARTTMLAELGDDDPRRQRGNAYAMGHAEGKAWGYVDALRALDFDASADELDDLLQGIGEPAAGRP